MSFKRILALVLALTMCMSIALPSGVAFADDDDDEIVIGGADPFNTPGTGPEIPTGNTCEHEWVATWSETARADYFDYVADVTFTCSKCQESQTFTDVRGGMVEEKEASCTEGGYEYVTVSKEFNGQTYSKTYYLSEPTEPDPNYHVFYTHVEAKAATCTEDGNIEYYRCPECGKYFTDDSLETEIPANQIVIPATGVHDYENGVCTGCGFYEWPQAGLTGPSAYNKQVNVRPFEQILSSSPDIYGKVTPSVAYTFSIYEDEAHNRITDYGNWKCDYVVSITGGVNAYSFGLFGNYGEFGDIAFFTPQDIGENDEIPLLLSAATNAWTYEMVYNLVQSFTCGAFNTYAENEGKIFTVKLVLWDPAYGSDYFAAKAANAVHVVQKIDYKIGTTSPLYIDGTPYTYQASGTDPEGFTLNEYGQRVDCAVIDGFNGRHYAPVREPQINVSIEDNAVVADIDAGCFTADAVESITIPGPQGMNASVTFSVEAVETIAQNAANSDIKLKVEDVTATGETGNSKTYEITMVKMVNGVESGAVFSEANAAGTATVSVPFTATGAAPVVVYLVVGETKTAVPCSYADGVVTFTVEHFSTYTVEQQADSVAKIVTAGGTRYYSSLADAINDAAAGDTVTLLTDVDLGSAYLNIDKALTLTSETGHTYTVTSSAAQAVMLTGSGDVTIDGVNITATAAYPNGRGVKAGNDTTSYSGALTFRNGTITATTRGIDIYEPGNGISVSVSNAVIQSRVADPTTTYQSGANNHARGIALWTYSDVPFNVTINNTTIKGFEYCVNVAGDSGAGNVTVSMTGGATYGRAAINNHASNNTFSLTNVDIHGLNNQTGPTESFACIVDDEDAIDNIYNINACTFTATLSEAAMTTSGSGATQYMTALRGTNATVNYIGNVTYSTNDTSGERSGLDEYLCGGYDVDAIVNLDSTANSCLASLIEELPAHDSEGTDQAGYVIGAVAATVEHDNTVTKYSSLADAIEAALPGDTVTLQHDVTLASTLNIAADKDFILALNGHDISGAVNGKLISNAGTLVIDGSGHVYNTDTTAQGHDAVYNTGTLEIWGGTFGDADDEMDNANAYNRGAAIRNCGGTLTIYDGNFTACDNYTNGGYAYAIINDDDGTTTIEYATVYGKNNGNIANNSGKVIVNNGVFSLNNAGSYYSVYCDEDAQAVTTIYGGAFSNTTNNGLFHAESSASGSKIVVYDGKFNYTKFTNHATPNAGNIEVAGGEFSATVDAGYCAIGYVPVVEPNDDGMYTVDAGENVAVLTSGETTTLYTSLKDAVAAAKDGDTIELIADDDVSLTDGSRLTIDKSLTITGAVDGSGAPLYTIYGTSNVTGTNNIYIDGSATVTIQNVNVSGFGTEKGTDGSHAPIYVASSFTGDVNLENIHVSEFNRGGIFLYGGTFNVDNCYIDCANNRSGAFTKGIEIKGSAAGTIKDTVIVNMERSSTTYSTAGIEIYGNGSITVDGCWISDDVGHTTGKATYGIVSQRVGEHDPSGGTLRVTDTYISVTNAALSVADNDEYGPTNDYTIIVDDCSFDNYIATWSATSSITINSGSYAEDVYAVAGTIIIHGGEFTNFAPDTDTGSILIDGGTFDVPVPAEYCAPGFEPKDNGDGTYGVEKVKAFAAYDENGDLVGAYTTLNAAIEAGGDGCTVKLVADVYEQQQINSQMTPVTFDLNGNWIDVDGGAGLNFSMGYYWQGDHVFTVKDRVGTGGINITPKYTGNACISDNTGRTIIVESGTFTSTGKAVYCTASNATMTISGGTFNGDVYVHDTGYGHGDLSITGGTVIGTLTVIDNAEIAVSGGTFSEPVPEAYCAEGYIPKANPDGTYGVKVGSYVAQIGDVKYEGLYQAANAVAVSETPATIVLLKDIEVTDSTATQGLFYVANGKNIVLDMNGHAITYTICNRWSSSPYISSDIYVQSGGSLTITGKGTMVNSGSSTAAIIRNDGTLVIENGSFSVTNATSGFMQILDNRGDATINDGTFTGLTRTQTISNGAGSGSPTLTINGGTISSTTKDAIDNHGHVTVNAGTIQGGASTGTPPAHAINTHGRSAEPEAVTTTITGGTILAGTGGVSEDDSCFSASSGITVVSGGTFNQSVEVYDGNGHVTIQGAEINPETNVYQVVPAYTVTFNSNGGSDVEPIKVPKNGTTAERTITTAPVPTKDEYCFSAWLDGSTVVAFPYEVTADVTLTAQWVDAVAAVYDDEDQLVGYYTSLNEALNSIYDPDYTVMMLADVELSEGVDISGNVTLDLNGKTISDAEGITTDYLVAVLHGGTLTVEDTASGDGGKISMSKSYCAIKMTKAGNTAEYAAEHPANLIVNSGHIEGKDFAISGNGNSGRGNANITVNGGTIRNTKTSGSGNDAAIYQPNTGTVTLNGGTIIGLTGVEVRSGSLTIPADSTVVITGTGNPATYAGNGNGTTTYGAGIAIAQHTTDNPISVSIAGGNVYGAYALAVVNPNERTGDNVSVAVSGGTFIGTGTDKKALNVTDNRVSKFISGGFFSEKIEDAYCTAGLTSTTTVDENGLYTVVEDGKATYSASLTLNDNIDVNFYVKGITDAEKGDYVVKYTFEGIEGQKDLAEVERDGYGRYRVIVADVSSYQMGKTILITVNYKGADIESFTYSVSTYFHNIIKHYGSDASQADFVDLCYKGLDYGAAAQLYFDGKIYYGGTYDADIENLVNADTNPSNIVNANQPTGYSASAVGSITGVSGYSPSLVLGSETSIKVYFKCSDPSVLSFSAKRQDKDGARVVTAVQSEEGGRYSVRITGIKSYELNKNFELTISNGSESIVLTYSPYTYAQRQWNSADTKLANLCHAFVAYGDAASTWYPNG